MDFSFLSLISTSDEFFALKINNKFLQLKLEQCIITICFSHTQVLVDYNIIEWGGFFLKIIYHTRFPEAILNYKALKIMITSFPYFYLLYFSSHYLRSTIKAFILILLLSLMKGEAWLIIREKRRFQIDHFCLNFFQKEKEGKEVFILSFFS